MGVVGAVLEVFAAKVLMYFHQLLCEEVRVDRSRNKLDNKDYYYHVLTLENINVFSLRGMRILEDSLGLCPRSCPRGMNPEGFNWFDAKAVPRDPHSLRCLRFYT